MSDADVLLTCSARITAALIDAAPRLRGIVKYGVGVDAIDIEAAMRRRIPVANVPEYAEETVAEGAMALMLALARKFKPLQREMQTQGWAWPTAAWLGSDLAGKTLGLVGVGRIGASVARMAGQGFRMKVVGFDPYVSGADMLQKGVAKCDDLHELLARSDIVSVHAVLTPHTRHLLSERELKMMKPSAMIVNVSRGAIIDEAALVRALQS